VNLSIARVAAALPAVLAAGTLAGCGAAQGSPVFHTPASSARVVRGIPGGDWPEFDFNAGRTGVGPRDTGISAADLRWLRRRTVRVPGTVDSAPIELHRVRVRGRLRDTVVMTTSYGITFALDPGTGRVLWQFRPRDLGALITSGYQVTDTTPIADPSRRYVYGASPDGYIHKLRVSDGRVVWSRRVTLDATREKLAGALNIEGRSVIVVTDGYIGDAPKYQGHILTLDRGSGRITHVWNSLCSDRHRLIAPSTCPASDSAIWGRSGSVIEPSGRILIATGNAPFNGSTDWGDSVLELSPTLRLLHNWTPANQADLAASDTDIGSTEPALLPEHDGRPLAVQGGKDGILRLLDLDRLDGTTGPAGPRTGGELQRINAPGPTDVFTAPAVWSPGGHSFVFVADENGTSAYELGGNGRLFVAWSDGTPGTSPVVAGGLLYVYDQIDGVLEVRSPVSGRELARLPVGSGHWNSPIVVGGRIILPVGSYHDHATTGEVEIYHLPGR
jgi:hypothetical protein